MVQAIARDGKPYHRVGKERGDEAGEIAPQQVRAERHVVSDGGRHRKNHFQTERGRWLSHPEMTADLLFWFDLRNLISAFAVEDVEDAVAAAAEDQPAIAGGRGGVGEGGAFFERPHVAVARRAV